MQRRHHCSRLAGSFELAEGGQSVWGQRTHQQIVTLFGPLRAPQKFCATFAVRSSAREPRRRGARPRGQRALPHLLFGTF